LFLFIKSGRDEHVDLRRDHREGQEGRAEHRELELGQEIFEQRGVDEFRIRGARDEDERPDQNVVDLLGKEEADHESDGERDQRLDQARAQFDQMVEKRGLALLDLVVFALVHVHAAPLSGLAGFVSAVSAGATVSAGAAGLSSKEDSTSLRTDSIGFSICLVTLLAALAASSNCFFRSASSASRSASWNWP